MPEISGTAACVHQGSKRLRLMLIVGLAGAASAPAFASPTPATDVPPGSIIYLREVPVRHAYLPGEPGTPHFVRTSPADEILALTSGLGQELSDDVNAQVSSGPGSNSGLAALAQLPGDLQLTLQQGASDRHGLSAQGLAPTGMITSAVGQATSSIGGAMTALQSALGGK